MNANSTLTLFKIFFLKLFKKIFIPLYVFSIVLEIFDRTKKRVNYGAISILICLDTIGLYFLYAPI